MQHFKDTGVLLDSTRWLRSKRPGPETLPPTTTQNLPPSQTHSHGTDGSSHRHHRRHHRPAPKGESTGTTGDTIVPRRKERPPVRKEENRSPGGACRAMHSEVPSPPPPVQPPKKTHCKARPRPQTQTQTQGLDFVLPWGVFVQKSLGVWWGCAPRLGLQTVLGIHQWRIAMCRHPLFFCAVIFSVFFLTAIHQLPKYGA